jgi:hypothetical protein
MQYAPASSIFLRAAAAIVRSNRAACCKSLRWGCLPGVGLNQHRARSAAIDRSMSKTGCEIPCLKSQGRWQKERPDLKQVCIGEANLIIAIGVRNKPKLRTATVLVQTNSSTEKLRNGATVVRKTAICPTECDLASAVMLHSRKLPTEAELASIGHARWRLVTQLSGPAQRAGLQGSYSVTTVPSRPSYSLELHPVLLTPA